MNRPAQSFRDLIVWQKAHEFVLRTYELTKQLDWAEVHALQAAGGKDVRSER
ncbi:MAG: four helix bundle protein [Chthoniobacterales bacterium]